jgi:hypothetical protein
MFRVHEYLFGQWLVSIWDIGGVEHMFPSLANVVLGHNQQLTVFWQTHSLLQLHFSFCNQTFFYLVQAGILATKKCITTPLHAKPILSTRTINILVISEFWGSNGSRISLAVWSWSQMIFAFEDADVPFFVGWILSQMHPHEFKVNSKDTNIDQLILVVAIR